MTAVLPGSCAVALKEWALVSQALLRGEQLVLIRKGGLIEPGTGFEILSETFVLYPTFEHQTVNYVREPYRGYFDEAAGWKPADGRLRVEVVGQAVFSTQTKDPDAVRRLAPFHIYNDEFLNQRLKWQPDMPLVIVAVRAFRLPAPQTIPLHAGYAGCKSWVNLEDAVSLHGARPVLDDAAFEPKLAKIRELC